MVIQHFTKGKHEKKKGGIRNSTIVLELKAYYFALHEKKKEKELLLKVEDIVEVENNVLGGVGG